MTLQMMDLDSMSMREKADFLDEKKVKLLEDYDWNRYDDLLSDEKVDIGNSIESGHLVINRDDPLNIMVIIPAGSIVTLKTSMYKSMNTKKDALCVEFVLENGETLWGGLDYLKAEFVEE